MVTISKALSASQAQSYHKLEFTAETQSYYKQGGAVEGEWQGRLAEKFGLSGAVNAQDFSKLAEGINPRTDEQMVRHRGEKEYENADGSTTKAVEHRAGWDATFSAPKSVSLTALVGGDERVREAHRAAVTTALTELEKYTQARIGGNNPAEMTGKFVAAKFEHDTARPVDGYAAPQLHTHAVIFNVTERPDGSMRAVQPQGLFESQNFATAVYQSALTYQLRDLGYEIEPGRSGAPQIKGYSQAYLDASSLRSQQIREHLEKAGQSSPEAAQIAAHATRDGKRVLTPDEVLAAHKQVAAEFGNQAERVVNEARERAQTQTRKPNREAEAKEAVSYARASLFEREAVNDERAILRDALRRGMGETTYPEVRSEFEARREQGQFVQVTAEKYDTGRKLTTPETIASEKANIAVVLEGQNKVEPIATKEQATAQAESRSFLNAAQRAAIAEVLTSPDRIQGIQGLAGTGKTTALENIREGAEKNGYAVEGFAPTSKAAGQLREAGISATTLQSFLARGGMDQNAGDPASRHLYMLDESSLASTQQVRAFLEKINSQDRVLFIGDTRQHQGVDAGRPFEQMQDAGLRTSQLDQIMRQKDPELLKAVEHLAKNETAAGVRMLAEQGRVTEIPDAKARIEAIAKDYAAQPEGTIIVSPDNRSRQAINEAVRTELQANGTVAKDGQEFQTLVQRSDLTGADRGWAARYEPGNVLYYSTGSKEQGIERGSFATVLSTNPRENTVTVEREDGESVTYDPRRLRGVNAYREVPREIANGDRIQFTAPNKELGVANRDLGTVTNLENGRITVQMDGKTPRSVTFDGETHRNFDHGYALTSHSSQGLTADRVLANIDTESSRNLINTRLAYVSISRAAEDARIYTNDETTLAQRLETDITKTAAVDFRQQPNDTTQEVDNMDRTKRRKSQSIEELRQQGRVHEYEDQEHRLRAVAQDYAAEPDRNLIVAPDPEERQELSRLVREELQAQGRLPIEGQAVPVLVEQDRGNPRAAASYEPGDLIQYKLGSPELEGIAHNSEAIVLSTDAKRNLITVETRDGEMVSYDPAQLKEQSRQSTIYSQEERELAPGDRIQLTEADKEQGIRAGALGTVERIAEDNVLSVRLDSGKSIELEPQQARHIDYGYAVETARGAQADRVLYTQDQPLEIEDRAAAALKSLSLNTREVSVYTSDGSQQLEQGSEIQQPTSKQNGQEPTVEVSTTSETAPLRIAASEPDRARHYAPLEEALTQAEASQFEWLAETGSIQSYQHSETGRNLHTDSNTGQFYDQERNPITADAALDHAMPAEYARAQVETPSIDIPSSGLQDLPELDLGGFGL